MKEFYIGGVLFVIIASMLYIFEPDYLKKPGVNHENKIQYDKLIFISIIISFVLTTIIHVTMSCDKNNMKSFTAKESGENNIDVVDDIGVSETITTSKFKTYDSGERDINPNVVSAYI